jgi:hypothetical protein
VLIAWVVPSVYGLALALLAAAILEAVWQHLGIWRIVGKERRPVPTWLVGRSLRHGLVSVFDKLTSAVGSGPFLLIVLPAYYGRVDLALLAIAADLVQRALVLTSLPVGNMILPYLNRAADDDERYVQSASKVLKLSSALFLSSLGATCVIIPSGMPLIFGEPYADATSLALLFAVPAFFDAWARFSLSSSLATQGRYGDLVWTGTAQATLALVVLLLTYDKGLILIAAGQGLVKVLASAVLAYRAHRRGLFRLALLPRNLAVTVTLAAAAGFALDAWLSGTPVGRWSACAALLAYVLVYLAGMRRFGGFDEELLGMIRALAGRHRRLVDLIAGPK